MEPTTSSNSIKAIKEVRKLFNELKNNPSRKETKKIRNELYKKEAIYNFLKEKDSLTNKQKIALNNINIFIKK